MQIRFETPTANRAHRLGAAMLTFAVVAFTFAWDTSSAAEPESEIAPVIDPFVPPLRVSTTTPASTTVIPPDAATPPATRTGTDPGGVATEVLAAVEERAPALVNVEDPRAGDLRTVPDGDLLPAGYTAQPAASVTSDVAYGPDPAHRLDLHLPADENAPAIVYLHAGGWVGGKRIALPEMVLRFVEKGYAVATIDYRLAPEHPFPAAVHDGKRAVRWIKAHGEATGAIDPDRVVIYGASAGGHLAAFIAATAGTFEPTDLPADLARVDSSVRGVVSMVGPTDLETLYEHPHPWAAPLTAAFVGCDPCAAEQLQEASPLAHLHDDVPPAYWGYGSDDTLIDVDTQARAIAQAWADHGGPESSWLDIVESEGHNLDETLVNQRMIEQFVDRAIGRASV